MEPPPPPVNISLPAITGTPQQGLPLSAQNGTWSNEPTSFGYEWQRCDAAGAKCSPISGAMLQSYTLAPADVGSTLRVTVTATNGGGPSAAVTSAQTMVVAQAASTFGKTTVGASADVFVAERKRVNRYALATPGSVTKLSIYLAPTGTAGEQALKGLIYADSSGTPGALLAVSEALTFKSTNAAGWYELSSPPRSNSPRATTGSASSPAPRLDGSRASATTASPPRATTTPTPTPPGPSNPFGTATTDSEQTSLYATYTSG